MTEMNETLQKFAREQLKDGLKKLPLDWQNTFKLMHGRAGGERSVEQARSMPIEDVVDEMVEDRLDWALTQVENSLKKTSTTRDLNTKWAILTNENDKKTDTDSPR